MSRSQAPLYIFNLQIRLVYESVVWRTGRCSRLGVAVSGLASLVGVIYRLVGMCSGARRIMSFLLGKKHIG